MSSGQVLQDLSDITINSTHLRMLNLQIKLLDNAIKQSHQLNQLLHEQTTSLRFQTIALFVSCIIFLLVVLITAINQLIITVRHKHRRSQCCSTADNVCRLNETDQRSTALRPDFIPNDTNYKMKEEYDLKFKNFINKTPVNVKTKHVFV